MIEGGAWLTVAEAAARLRVSERTVRRRCEAGKLVGELRSTLSGPSWFVSAAAMPADTAAKAADGEARVTPHDPGDTSAPSAAMLRTPADTSAPDLITALLAEKDARINDLREQLKATNGALEREQSAHAETRRLFAFSVSALPSPTNQPPDVATTSATPNRPPQRRPRPFWAVLIGYRPK